MASLDILEQRLAALEQEVAQLKAASRGKASPPQPSEESRGARMIRKAREGHAEVVAGWRKLMQNLGIQGQPIGAKELRALLLESGINPEANEVSREIIATREE